MGASSCLLLFLTLGSSLALDGCEESSFWRCGDVCIGFESTCDCGGHLFNRTEGKWCCQNVNCFPTGGESYWTLDAYCDGTPLGLDETCNNTCNFHQDDEFGSARNYKPCTANHMKTTECIPEGLYHDGKYDCSNRADEEPFRTEFENLDLDKLLVRCTVWESVLGMFGNEGFKCSGPSTTQHNTDCLPVSFWCNAQAAATCDELVGTTATGESIDPMLCSNQTFWEKTSCGSEDTHRCTGDRPGQCGLGDDDVSPCTDGSRYIPSEKVGQFF